MKLILGDCLEIMSRASSNSVDSIVTDPPYGMSFQSNYRNEKYKPIENDDSVEWLDIFMKQAHRVLRDNTHLYCFCSYHNVDKFKVSIEKFFKLKNILIWEKNNTSMGDLKGDYAPKYEMILFAHKGRKVLNGGRDPNIMKFKRTGNKNHPTEKPVDLIQYLIEKSTDLNGVVLDPFMGSGTTGVACKNIGREFIGIERDEAYFKIAEERINAKA